MTSWKSELYGIVKRSLPHRLAVALGGSSALRPIRDRFFRPKGVPEIHEGSVSWAGLQFHFAAPLQILYHAQHPGLETEICRLARSLLHDGDVALDVGASYGFITIVMGKSVQPRGRVLSFEVDTRICDVLARTIESNNLAKTVFAVAKRVGSEDSDDCVTVDSMVRKHQVGGVHFIKIDVDGEDFDVLRGASKTLNAYHPVVVIEMTTQQSEIYDFLVACGYSQFCDQSRREVSRNEWPVNLVASIKPIVMPRSAGNRVS
jgi:hypothetical protein